MAFRIENKFPIDARARQAVGVSLPFSGQGVFNSTYTTADQIKSNLFNFFNTEPGERYMNTSFGGGLKTKVFEQVNTGTFENIKIQLQTQLNLYFPNISIQNLDVYGNEDLNMLKVILSYQVVNFGIEDTLEILLQ